jgi:hypothetical protein
MSWGIEERRRERADRRMAGERRKELAELDSINALSTGGQVRLRFQAVAVCSS